MGFPRPAVHPLLQVTFTPKACQENGEKTRKSQDLRAFHGDFMGFTDHAVNNNEMKMNYSVFSNGI